MNRLCKISNEIKQYGLCFIIILCTSFLAQGQYSFNLSVKTGLSFQSTSYGDIPLILGTPDFIHRTNALIGVNFEIPIKSHVISLGYTGLHLSHTFISSDNTRSFKSSYSYRIIELTYQKYFFSSKKLPLILESGLSYLYKQDRDFRLIGIQFNDSNGNVTEVIFDAYPDVLQRTFGCKVGLSTNIPLFKNKFSICPGVDYYAWLKPDYIKGTVRQFNGSETQLLKYKVTNPSFMPYIKLKFRI